MNWKRYTYICKNAHACKFSLEKWEHLLHTYNINIHCISFQCFKKQWPASLKTDDVSFPTITLDKSSVEACEVTIKAGIKDQK